ncbi:MAG: amidohydrolase family protein [Acidimicrobiia bacterium]
MTLPDRERALVRGAWVLTMGPEGSVRDGAVLVSGGRIDRVGTYDQLVAEYEDVEVVGDGTGIVTPGLINAHTHLSEALIPGMGSEMTLFEWGREIVTPVSEHLTQEMAAEGTVLRSAEMLHSGVTYVNDMFVHSNSGSRASLGVVDGLARVGLRGCVSFGAENALDGVTAMEPLTLDEIMFEHEALAAAAEGEELVDFRLGIGTLLGQSDKLLELGVDACKRHGWVVHTHLAEDREEIVHSSLRWGRRTIAHAASIGLLDVPVVAGHVIWVTEDDVAMLSRAQVAVAYNPVANMILGSGVCPVPRLRSAGLPVGIGTDGAASNDSQNMLEAVKAAPLLQKISAVDPSVMSAEDALTMATIEGARALGIDAAVGSLEPGKAADLVLFGGTAELAAIHDPFQQLVYCSSPRSVSNVWVDGRRLVSEGSLTSIDEGAQIATARALARDLAEVAGLCDRGYSQICTTP